MANITAKKQVKQILRDYKFTLMFKHQCDYIKVLNLLKNGDILEPSNSSENFFLGVYYDIINPDKKAIEFYKKAISGGNRDAMYSLQDYYTRAGLDKESDKYFTEIHCKEISDVNGYKNTTDNKQKLYHMKIAAKNGNIDVIIALLNCFIDNDIELYIEYMKLLINTIMNDSKFSFSGRYLLLIISRIFPNAIPTQLCDDLVKFALFLEKQSKKCNHLKIIANGILGTHEGGSSNFQKSVEYCLKFKDAFDHLLPAEKKEFYVLSNKNLIKLGSAYSQFDTEKTLDLVPQLEKIIETDKTTTMALGMMCRNIKRYDLAHKYYKMAYKTGNHHALCDIGCIFHNLDKKDESLKCFDLLIKQPDLCETCLNSMLNVYKEYNYIAGINKCYEIMRNMILEKQKRNAQYKLYEHHHINKK
jgi:TPR repeat protein